MEPSSLRIVGSLDAARTNRLVATLAPGTAMVALAGHSAAPTGAHDVTESVTGLIDSLQSLSDVAARRARSMDVVIAVITPREAVAADCIWRRALDEAVTGVTQSLCREYVPDVLRVNAIQASEGGLGDLISTAEFLSHDAGTSTIGATLDVRPASQTKARP